MEALYFVFLAFVASSSGIQVEEKPKQMSGTGSMNSFYIDQLLKESASNPALYENAANQAFYENAITPFTKDFHKHTHPKPAATQHITRTTLHLAYQDTTASNIFTEGTDNPAELDTYTVETDTREIFYTTESIAPHRTVPLPIISELVENVLNLNVENINSPPENNVCHYRDPNVEKCIKFLTDKAQVLLSKGAPAIGIPPLEPLKIPSIRLRQNNKPENKFKYDAWLSNVLIQGLGNFSINKLDVYPEEMKVTANVALPYLELLGEYVLIGKFQMLPVESSGKIKSSFSECTAQLAAVGAQTHKHIVVRDVAVRLNCNGPLKTDLNDAHSSTGELEMITTHIAQMHSSEIMQEVHPAVETALSMVLEDVANKFLKTVPDKVVFMN